MINDIMQELLVCNFELISKKEEFKALTYTDLVLALQRSECPDIVKWDAILNWTKHDKRRKKRLPELLRFLDLGALSVDFIQTNVRQEALVKESTEAMMMLLDALAAKLRTADDAKEPDNCAQIESPPNTPQDGRDWITVEAEVVDSVNLDVPGGGEEVATNPPSPKCEIQQSVEYLLTPEELPSEYEGNIPKELNEDNRDSSFCDGQLSAPGSSYPHEIYWSEGESFETARRRCSSSYPHHPPPFHPHHPRFHPRPWHPPPPPPPSTHVGLHPPRHRHRHPPPHHHPPPFHRNRLSRRRGHPL